MTIEVAVFNAAGLLPTALEVEIRAGIDDGIKALRRHLDIEGAGIVVLLNEGVDPETGIGGRAYGLDACEIRVDEASPALRVGTRINAASVTVHELHHVLRMRHGVPRRFAELCAGDIIVLEGLATRCQAFLGYPDPSIVRGITAEQVVPLLDRIAPVVGDPGADWAWIYGPSGLPAEAYKAVYAMGHHVVGRYLARSGLTPLEAVGVPWREVWNVGLPIMP